MNTEHDDSWKRWADMVAKTIGDGWEDLIRLTEDGLEVQPIYPAHAISAYPAFTGAGWLMAQYVADDTATALLNRSMLDELEGGTNMIMFPLIVAAEMTASHMPDILDGVYTNACQFGYPHGGDAVKLAAIWAEYAKRCDDKGQSLKVHLGADPVADIMFDRFDHVDTNDQVAALARWQTCHQSDLPDIRCFAAGGDAYHRYGLTDAQELGLCLASLVWQWRILEESGLSPEQAISGSVMRIAVTADLYSALSKTRAARILLNQISAVMDNDKTPLLHGFTSDRMMTRIEPVNNVLRHVTASLGTALGGAELITTLPHDWLSGSTGMSRRLARNLQLIMRDEARIDQVADPAHGAHTLEAMSQSLAQKAWQIFQKIERAGGAMTVATSSLLSDWAKTASESRQADMDNRHHGMLGINHHPQQPTDPLPPLIMECGHPRGGMVRPAQPWEDMRLAAYDKGFRCLILNNGDSDMTLIARWADELRMAGIQMADIRIANTKEARAQIATAKPHLLVASHAVLSMLTDDGMEKISIPSVPLDADGKARRQMIMAVIESDGWGYRDEQNTRFS
ncbi:MAG: methylmalonyl-CoA mutase family protein [Candidatus Puniceispirillales bacterium]